MYCILMNFFNEHSDGVEDFTNSDYARFTDCEYYSGNPIVDKYYSEQYYLNEKEENQSTDGDNGSHLGNNEYDYNDGFIASDDDLESDDDEEYVPKKKQKK